MRDDPTGVTLIATERHRQVHSEGRDAPHDDAHGDQALAWAAVCYAAPDRVFRNAPAYTYQHPLTGQPRRSANRPAHQLLLADPWPWRPFEDKRQERPWADREVVATGGLVAERVRELTKAGALIAAEIDRLLRAEARHAR